MKIAGTPLSVGVAIVDDSGTIVFWSKGAEELSGFQAYEVLGRNVISVIGYQLRDIEEAMEELHAPEGRFNMIRRADGSTVPVQWESHKVLMPSGESVHVSLTISTPSVAAIAENVELHHSFLEQAPFGFGILDVNLRYIMVNEALAQINRRAVEDHPGRHLSEVIKFAELPAYERALQRVLETGEPVQNLRFAGVPTAEHAAGQVWSVSWYRLSESNGKPIGLCGIIFDVTYQEPAILDAARSRAHLSMIADLSIDMTTAPDVYTSAHRLTQLLTKGFSEYAAVDVLQSVARGAPPATRPFTVPAVTRLASCELPHVEVTSEVSEIEHEKVIEVLTTGQARSVHTQNYVGLISPLRARGIVFGTVTVFCSKEREVFTPEDHSFLDAMVTRAALNLENTRLYAQYEYTARTLQRALLPSEIPQLDEVELAARYAPANDTAIGGDWFDVLPLPGRRVFLVLGDVMGHSVEAAAAMGRYRTAVAALASVGLSPSLLLTRLADLPMRGATLAACLCVLYDAARHVCHIASAGNPAPLVMRPDEGSEQVQCPPGPMLGVASGQRYSAVAVPTPPGSAMLLFSDGVVESRSVPMERGVDRITRLLSGGISADGLDNMCEQVVAASPSDRDDDATVLLARFSGLS